MSPFFKHFGGKVTPELKQRYSQSDHWIKGSFKNLERTTLGANMRDIPKMIYKQLRKTKGRFPEQSLPIHSFDKTAFLDASPKSKFIWYGHSVLLMQMEGKTLVIDPMLGPDTTPIAPMASKRFSEGTLDLIDDFPTIDLMLITHDHYDHLDFASIQKLKQKTKQYYVALGVKRHLVYWGVDPNLITEFDWWEAREFDNIKITFTPSRHFSGRGLRDRAMTLWGGWIFQTPTEKIWFSGDGGYGKHFEEIGRREGPFDLAFMECGQYNHDWFDIHMFPQDSVQAALDGGAKKAIPVHWGGFNLSYQHTWSEPPAQFAEAAASNNISIHLPEIGQIFDTNSDQNRYWWEDFL